jgi:type III restriction enzyme
MVRAKSREPKMKNGRVLAIEYKGKLYYDLPYSEEKRAVGEVWASRSNGQCRFVALTDENFAVLTKIVGA